MAVNLLGILPRGLLATKLLNLSERRGRSVADFLADRDISPARLVVEAVGESDPIARNASVEGRAANRRVELIVHPRAG